MDSWLRGLGLGLGRGAQATLSPRAAVDAAALPTAPPSPPFGSADPLDLGPVHGAATGMQQPRSPAAAVTPPSLRQPPPPQRRTQPAPGTAAALFPAEPSDPASLIGRRVERAFIVNKRTVVYEGVIDRARLLRHFGWRWHVSYEDGDDEDIAWQELRSCLVEEADGSGAVQAQVAWPHVRCGAAEPRRDAPDVAAAAVVPAALASETGAFTQAAVARAPSAGNGGGAPGGASAVPLAPGSVHFKGVRRSNICNGTFRAIICKGKKGLITLGSNFTTAVAAAEAYDQAARTHRRRVVNFPRPGSDEVQAVFGEADKATLRRLGLALGRDDPPLAGHSVRVLNDGESKLQPKGTVLAVTRLKDELMLREGIVAEKRTQTGHYVRLDDGKPRRVYGAKAQTCALTGGAGAAAGCGKSTTAVYGYGVSRTQSGFRAAPYLGNGGGRGRGRFYLSHHKTAKEAALAVDAELRKHGMLHKLNFPQTAEERAAAAARHDIVRQRRSEAQLAAAARKRATGAMSGIPAPPAATFASPPPPPKRQRLAEAAAPLHGVQPAAAALPVRAVALAPLPPAAVPPPPPLPTVLLPPPVPAPPAFAAGAASGFGASHVLPPSFVPAAAPGAAPAVLPAAAAPAAVPPPAPSAVAAAQSGSDAMAAFLRSITPPLQALPAILAAVPRSGFTLAHLKVLARMEPAGPRFQLLYQSTLTGLSITSPADQFSFTVALASLA